LLLDKQQVHFKDGLVNTKQIGSFTPSKNNKGSKNSPQKLKEQLNDEVAIMKRLLQLKAAGKDVVLRKPFDSMNVSKCHHFCLKGYFSAPIHQEFKSSSQRQIQSSRQETGCYHSFWRYCAFCH
jgi:hypothetical protein